MLRVLCVLVSLPEIVAGYCPDECGGSTSVGPEAFGGAEVKRLKVQHVLFSNTWATHNPSPNVLALTHSQAVLLPVVVSVVSGGAGFQSSDCGACFSRLRNG